MRIAVCGPHKDEVIAKVEGIFNTEVKTPWKEEILDQAAETYKYFNETNVVFSGSPFDYLTSDLKEGYDDLYEQICLDTLNNVNYIVVIAMDMDKATLKLYEEYAKLFPEKIYIYTTPAEFELRLR